MGYTLRYLLTYLTTSNFLDAEGGTVVSQGSGRYGKQIFEIWYPLGRVCPESPGQLIKGSVTERVVFPYRSSYGCLRVVPAGGGRLRANQRGDNTGNILNTGNGGLLCYFIGYYLFLDLGPTNRPIEGADLWFWRCGWAHPVLE